MTDRTKMHVVHGGHQGTEAEFGRAAEAWGLGETTISFEGHKMERASHVEVLDDDELRKGRISLEFVFQRMGRRFHRGHGLRRVMKSMYHIVVRSKALFAVGWIQEDDTVRGGTGWGVELAKVFNRELYVFDQEKDRWFHWAGNRWEAGEPTLPEAPIGATGTRNLTPAGRAAIHDLFRRSLGEPVAAEALERTS